MLQIWFSAQILITKATFTWFLPNNISPENDYRCLIESVQRWRCCGIAPAGGWRGSSIIKFVAGEKLISFRVRMWCSSLVCCFIVNLLVGSSLEVKLAGYKAIRPCLVRFIWRVDHKWISKKKKLIRSASFRCK